VVEQTMHVRLSIAERRVNELARLRLLEDDLVRNALRDPLTGLAKRSLFMERLEWSSRKANRRKDYLFACLSVTLDDPSQGPDTGADLFPDALMVEVARRLEECVRALDTLARIGPNEFAVLLDSLVDLSDGTRVANRIQQSISAPIHTDAGHIVTSASIGIALSATEYGSPEEVLRHAQMALARAKSQGPGSHQMYDPIMHARAIARMRVESNLRRALDQNELTLRYQPIMSIQTGKAVGFEALCYWNDPEHGLVSPGEFVPIAEQTGLVVPLGWWALGEALTQLKIWQDKYSADPPWTVGVNVSGVQFAEPDVFEQITGRIEESGLSAENLHLEITETALMNNVDSTLQVLQKLKEASVNLHVDDFGTGYSSLSYLCRFPIDTLKIDRSFVSQMNYSEESLEIVRTVVRLARNLGIGLIAEGVESEEQLNLLRELECDEAQGYHFAKPMAVTEVEEWLERQSR
jgi:diguanylate cyclase (GGDEF)-like protein